jgi:hypothetical protein
MRRAFYGALLAAAFAGAAQASDYIVVNSTDPGIKRGQALDSGARIPLAVGKTLTLMRPSGEITTLQGSAAGVTLPGARVAAADGARFDNLKALLDPPPQGRTFGARRGSAICPAPATLASLDDILKVADQPGCKAEAREALDAYIARSASGGAPK